MTFHFFLSSLLQCSLNVLFFYSLTYFSIGSYRRKDIYQRGKSGTKNYFQMAGIDKHCQPILPKSPTLLESSIVLSGAVCYEIVKIIENRLTPTNSPLPKSEK